jgi:putative transposase
VSSYIEEHRERFGVEPIRKTLEVSASAYYQRAKGERSPRSLEDERLLDLIAEIHEATTPDPAAHRRPDLVQRDFSATGPDRLWVGDFTYLRSWEGASFFSFVIDAFSRKVVGWQLASHMRTDLVLDALRMALGQRAPGADVELVAHIDRGSQ